MSTEKGEAIRSSSSQEEAAREQETSQQRPQHRQESEHTGEQRTTTPPQSGTQSPTIARWQSSEPSHEDQKPAALEIQRSDSTTPASTPTTTTSVPATSPPRTEDERPRQVIAVSASKGPAAFFNLARKFLVTDAMCDLSALEGAIVSAVDAANLLERSKLATIVRIQTSYVTVEPKRKKTQPGRAQQSPMEPSTSAESSKARYSTPAESPTGSLPPSRPGKTASARELKRARIIITVRRTENYEEWLRENPLQAILAGDGDEEDPIPPKQP